METEMDNRTLETLKEWMGQQDRAAWLRANPQHQKTLSPFTGLDSTLAAGAQDFCVASEPSNAAMGVGRSRLMAEVRSSFQPASSPASLARPTWGGPARASAAMALVVAAIGVVGGVTGVIGDGGLGQAVLDAFAGPTEEQSGSENAAFEADNGRYEVDDNAQGDNTQGDNTQGDNTQLPQATPSPTPSPTPAGGNDQGDNAQGNQQ